MAPAPLIGIIDDSEVYRVALDRLLRSAGYRTILFESADAFLIFTGNDEPDCLILDHQMPGTTGLELARRLTAMNYSAPFIMVSVDAEDLREAALRPAPRRFVQSALVRTGCSMQYVSRLRP